MTGIERLRVVVAPWLWVAAACLGAPGISAAAVGLVDARQPDAPAVVVGLQAPPQPQLLPFLRLSDPQARAVECCLRVQPQPADGGFLRYGEGRDRQATQPLPGLAAQRLGSQAVPFVGLVLPPSVGVQVLRRSARQVDLGWTDPVSGRAVRWQVRHCLSTEGLHLWWAEPGATGRAGARHHDYLPLGMEVEPDCPAAWLKP